VTICKQAKVYDSIIMSDSVIGENAVISKSVISEAAVIGAHTLIGQGENIINEDFPSIYNSGISVVGENTIVPENVWIGKNCALFGKISEKDFIDKRLESGKNILIEEVEE
jgi:glucose-1-phosphate adenylyltransferase